MLHTDNPTEETKQSRVHASQNSRSKRIARPGSNRPYQGTCQECGSPFAARTLEDAFCSSHCRVTFNNRRKSRGAELYDLVMAWRYERSLASTLKLFTKIAQMARSFREEDKEEREGRHSWLPVKAHIQARPHRFIPVRKPRGKKKKG